MPNVTLPPNTAVDLYVESGIATSVAITVTNLGTGDIRLSTTQAGVQNDFIPLNAYEQASNKSSDPGAWAFATSGGGVNVKEA